MLGNIYNCIDLDFKGLWKLQMDKFIWSQNDQNDKYLIILVSVYLSYMDDWKKAPEAYFAKKQISNFDVQYKSRSCNKTLCVNLIPVYEHDFACTLEIKAYIKALLPFIKF